MFNTLEEVPEVLREFYTEVSTSEPTGETKLVKEADLDGGFYLRKDILMHDVVSLSEKARPPIESEERLAMFVERMNHANIRDCAERILDCKKWAFHDEYCQWLLTKDIEDVNETVIVDGDQESSPIVEDEEPEYPSDTVESILAATDYAERCRTEAKLAGIIFEGKRCSATKEDMWGLFSVEQFVRTGASANFNFDSGDTLLLTPDNIDEFKALWVPFRASFFD